MNHDIFESFVWVFVANHVYRTQRSNQTIYTFKSCEVKEQKIKSWKHLGSRGKSWLGFSDDEAMSSRRLRLTFTNFSRELSRLGCGSEKRTADSAVCAEFNMIFQMQTLTRRKGEKWTANSAVEDDNNQFFPETKADSAEVICSWTPTRRFARFCCMAHFILVFH